MSKENAAGAAPLANKMGVLPVGKLLAGLAVPMMISMLVQALSNIVDSVFVSRLSENAFNAVGLAFPLQSLMIAVGAGTAVGINALLSRSLGEKKQEMADRAAGAGIFLLPICSYLVFAFIGLFLSRPFFVAQAKAVPEIVEYGVQYTRICLGLSVGIFSQFCFERLLQSTGRTSLAMCTQLLGAIINIVMDPILIFGLCGAPGWAWPAALGHRCWTDRGGDRGPDREYQVQPRHSHPPEEHPLGSHRGQGDLPGGYPLHHHAVHQFCDDLRHEQDPLCLYPHRHRRVRRVFQDPELRVHAHLRPEQRYGAHYFL